MDSSIAKVRKESSAHEQSKYEKYAEKGKWETVGRKENKEKYSIIKTGDTQYEEYS